MKINKSIFVGTSILCFLFLIFLNERILLKQVQRYLTYENHYEIKDPNKTLIVILGGGSGDRVSKGLDLYKKNNITHLLITGNKERYRFNQNPVAEYAAYLNIEPKHLSLAYESTSTYTDATLTLSYIKNKPLNHIVIVTSPLHSKRAYSTFKNVFRQKNLAGIDLKLTILVSDYKKESHYESREAILIELAKTVFYWLYY